jgi:hypothetical protein
MNKLFGHELGSEGYNSMIDSMRADLATSWLLSPEEIELRDRLETSVRERLRAEGKDFDTEFKKWCSDKWEERMRERTGKTASRK